MRIRQSMYVVHIKPYSIHSGALSFNRSCICSSTFKAICTCGTLFFFSKKIFLSGYQNSLVYIQFFCTHVFSVFLVCTNYHHARPIFHTLFHFLHPTHSLSLLPSLSPGSALPGRIGAAPRPHRRPSSVPPYRAPTR